jgi:hypothetical protein
VPLSSGAGIGDSNRSLRTSGRSHHLGNVVGLGKAPCVAEENGRDLCTGADMSTGSCSDIAENWKFQPLPLTQSPPAKQHGLISALVIKTRGIPLPCSPLALVSAGVMSSEGL